MTGYEKIPYIEQNQKTHIYNRLNKTIKHYQIIINIIYDTSCLFPETSRLTKLILDY